MHSSSRTQTGRSNHQRFRESVFSVDPIQIVSFSCWSNSQVRCLDRNRFITSRVDMVSAWVRLMVFLRIYKYVVSFDFEPAQWPWPWRPVTRWRSYKYRCILSTLQMHCWCHLDWEWNVDNLSVKLGKQNLTRKCSIINNRWCPRNAHRTGFEYPEITVSQSLLIRYLNNLGTHKKGYNRCNLIPYKLHICSWQF